MKEETVSIANRYEQLTSRAPSDVYMITDEDIRKALSLNIGANHRRIIQSANDFSH